MTWYPNGASSVIGEMYDEGGDPDGPFKWEFNFVTDDGLRVRVVRTWLALELIVSGRALPAEDVLAFLDHNLSVHSREVAEAMGRLEHHRLLINPYVRHRMMSEFARKELLAQTVPEIWYPSSLVASRADMERHLKSIQDHVAAARRETFFSVTLVSESAFMAEAFLNFLLAISLQKVIRENKELFEETLRRTWRAKIQHLPLSSMLVKKAPDLGDARVRDAEKLFALRNRIAHSYPDPDHLGTGVMYFFRNYPVLEHPMPFDGFQMATQRLLPTRDGALEGFSAGQGLVQFILEQIDEGFRKVFMLFANCSPLGYRADTGQYVRVFSDVMAKAFLPTDRA